MRENRTKETVSENFSNHDEGHQPTGPRSSLNPKEDKYKENHIWAHHRQTAENQR